MSGVVKRGIVFVLVLFSLFVLLVGTAMINPERMRKNIERSSEVLINEERTLLGTIIMTQKDRTADGVLLNMILNTDSSSPISSTLLGMHHLGIDRGGAFALSEALKGAEADTSYTRYWHGSMIFARILLLFTDIRGIRVILGILICAAAVVMGVILVKKGYYSAVFCFALSFIACGVMFGALSIETFYVPFMAIVFSAYVIRMRGDGERLMLFLLSGLFTAFFDFLTAETLTLTIPMLFMLYDMSRIDALKVRYKVSSTDDDARYTTFFCLRCAFLWLIGYAATFAIKWGICAALGLSASEDVKGNLFFRFFGSHVTMTERGVEKVSGLRELFLALGSNVSTLCWCNITVVNYYVYLGVFVTVLLILGYLFYLFRREGKGAVRWYHFALVGAIPIVRIMILSEHSLQHHFFTYRALWATVLAVMMMFCEEMLWSRK